MKTTKATITKIHYENWNQARTNTAQGIQNHGEETTWSQSDQLTINNLYENRVSKTQETSGEENKPSGTVSHQIFSFKKIGATFFFQIIIIIKLWITPTLIIIITTTINNKLYSFLEKKIEKKSAPDYRCILCILINWGDYFFYAYRKW